MIEVFVVVFPLAVSLVHPLVYSLAHLLVRRRIWWCIRWMSCWYAFVGFVIGALVG